MGRDLSHFSPARAVPFSSFTDAFPFRLNFVTHLSPIAQFKPFVAPFDIRFITYLKFVFSLWIAKKPRVSALGMSAANGSHVCENQTGKKNQRGSPAGGVVARSGGNLETNRASRAVWFLEQKAPEPAARQKQSQAIAEPFICLPLRPLRPSVQPSSCPAIPFTSTVTCCSSSCSASISL